MKNLANHRGVRHHGTTATGVSVGLRTLAADQAGNSNYNPAPQATRSFNIGAAAVPVLGPWVLWGLAAALAGGCGRRAAGRR